MGTKFGGLALALGLVLATAGCGDDSDAKPDLVDATSEVGTLDNSFRPAELTVEAGTTVVWENGGRNAHNVLPVEGEDWGVQAEEFAPGATFSHRFTEPGTYPYYCSLHGTTTKGMVGTVTVT